MQKTSILFFDGALKGNLEAAGAAAIVLDPSGQEELHCKWGLWKTTNNQEEAAALYQGLLQVHLLRLDSFMVVGDSEIIIKGGSWCHPTQRHRSQ